MNILWIGFLVLGACVSGQRNPTISYISPERIMYIGETTEMKCSVQYATGYSVLWTKIDENQPSGSIPLSKGTSLILPETRFSLQLQAASSTYILTIKDIQETDAGIYQCQVLISTQNVISAEVKLSVRRPPVISDDSTRSVVATVGENVQLECRATGYPTPNIFWRRQNNALLPTGGAIYSGEVLQINSVTKDDRGTYYCVAENYVGKGEFLTNFEKMLFAMNVFRLVIVHGYGFKCSVIFFLLLIGARRNVALDVEFAPVITVSRPRVGQALQYDMDLECNIEAYPQPAVTWLRDGFQLSNNQHYMISHFSTADEFTSTTLRVLSIEKKQYGKFQCQAANKFGIASATVELVETVIPVCPPACGTNQYSSGSEPVGGVNKLWHIFSFSSAAYFAARSMCPA
ncbi:unnamed protein product [Notodromas monacha]|uniref:Ig-like domain-containing protein n=1 Tax=Notodromas monacha TaxID=399045 RepID=A0A7R9GBG6_9CRUS|nr:unnamed protein product [Notodromas monacha]CAG0914977.1 unnamed protein product [Notodromas monacha]